MLKNAVDAQAFREILEFMQPYVLEEGRMYRCTSDFMIRAHSGASDRRGNEHLAIEEGTIVIPCRDKDGSEAVLIGGVVVPCMWTTNATSLMFEPIDL